jgi:hypothetical protein
MSGFHVANYDPHLLDAQWEKIEILATAKGHTSTDSLQASPPLIIPARSH